MGMGKDERIMTQQKHLLEIHQLNVRFPLDKTTAIHAVNDVDLYLDQGETLGVVGESGCGKSVTMSSILRLVKSPPAVIKGEILYNDQNILDMLPSDLFKIRGNEITMIFQEPMTSLDPVMKIGDQIAETILRHEKISKNEANARVLELLKQVEIPSPEKRMKEYPHQLSGGMRQRIMIAMALACRPNILLADEPTTALDVTIQAQILELLKKLKQQYGMSIMIVTHDLGVIAEIAQRVVVFYGGQIVEEADTVSLFKNPLHPYTEGLLGCIPLLNTESTRLNVIEGNVPDPSNFPSGCIFHPRCKYATPHCAEEAPGRCEAAPGHFVRCHLAKERVQQSGALVGVGTPTI